MISCIFTDLTLAFIAGMGCGLTLALAWAFHRLDARARWMQELLDGLSEEQQRLQSLRQEFEED